MKGKVNSLAIAALKQLGKKNVTQEVELQLTKSIEKRIFENIQHDARLAPEWISKLILNLAKYSEK